MAENEPSSAPNAESPANNGDENFSEDIKDYAKTTMNELLGMFGYDDEMTSESVSSLDIKVPDSMKDTNSTTPNPVTTTSALGGPVDPVIVSVEGSTTVSDVVRKHGEGVAMSTAISHSTTAAASTAPTDDRKTEPALAPHFYAKPPAVRGLFCIVANLPMADNPGKGAMTFKFWNCITCSEYFLEKPEVVFRIQHPHLFSGQPEWLYQAAVCVKCHQGLNSLPPSTVAIPVHQSKATFKVIECDPQRKPIKEVTTSNSCVSTSSEFSSSEKTTLPDRHTNGIQFKKMTQSEPSRDHGSLETRSTNDLSSKESYKCYICCKSVKQNSRQGKLRRSKFSSLFTELPDNVGHFKVCSSCFDRLSEQREQFIQANIPENERDYVGHIKVWTGIDITCKSSSTYTPIVCVVCDRLTDNCKEPNRPIFRSRYPTLFRNLPESVIHLPICDKCYKKLQKVKLRYDNLQTEEEKRDYVQFINLWRSKKGLGKHSVFA
ncbi:predicted protein [Nematostella vectensis]|uniref:Uncharacterized protein n=1 Tax=Nematostella vectensis TaxID=45351 RepID=A7S5E4_NEMVE|nr:predicted protein [Nematostella vectensis]|eukprot:XP_001633173.1 predicted protein [Nematostella vectensis]